MKNIPNVKATYRSKMKLKDLPIELQMHILSNISPDKRRRLRLVNKMMLNVVDRSMSDVKKIIVSKSKNRYSVKMNRVHPCTGKIVKHGYKIAHSSVSPLLRWAGPLTETLEIYSNDEPHAESVRQVLKTLSTTDACGELKNLYIIWGGSVHDCAVVLRYLLEYVTKRRMEAKLAGAEMKRPFLRSLVLMIYIHSREEQHLQLLKIQIRGLLQLIMDECDGLKLLRIRDDNTSEILILPALALRYPATLTNLDVTGLSKTPGELCTVIKNCPNLQLIELDSALLREEAVVSAVASLSDLRKLVINDAVKEGGAKKSINPVELIERCLMAFGEHPFGAITVNPWPRLSTVFLQCFLDDDINIRGWNGVVTSLSLTISPCYDSGPRRHSVRQVLRMLNETNACPKLKELNIAWCPLDFHEADSSVLYELLAFITKRQSQVKTGTPFLRSLTLSQPQWCNHKDPFRQPELSEKLDEMRCILQKVFDQSHGLEELDVADLLKVMCLPVVGLRYPRTLTSLKSAPLSNASGELRTLTTNCPNLKIINKVSVEFLIRASTR